MEWTVLFCTLIKFGSMQNHQVHSGQKIETNIFVWIFVARLRQGGKVRIGQATIILPLSMHGHLVKKRTRKLTSHQNFWVVIICRKCMWVQCVISLWIPRDLRDKSCQKRFHINVWTFRIVKNSLYMVWERRSWVQVHLELLFDALVIDFHAYSRSKSNLSVRKNVKILMYTSI